MLVERYHSGDTDSTGQMGWRIFREKLSDYNNMSHDSVSQPRVGLKMLEELGEREREREREREKERKREREREEGSQRERESVCVCAYAVRDFNRGHCL